MAVFARSKFIQDRTNPPDQFEVGNLVAAADDIGFTGATLLQSQPESPAVVAHMQPIANLAAIAVDGQGLLLEAIQDHEGDELFRKLRGTVIVRAIDGDKGNFVGVKIGAGKVIAGRLGGGVRTVGGEARRFGKRRVLRRQGAEDFVGGDMNETKSRFLLRSEALPMVKRGFQQTQGAEHVGLNKNLGRVDRAIDMAFGRKVDHARDPMFLQQGGDRGGVADVALRKGVTRDFFQFLQVGKIARIGELVETDDRFNGSLARIGIEQMMANEIGADKSRASGDQKPMRARFHDFISGHLSRGGRGATVYDRFPFNL